MRTGIPPSVLEAEGEVVVRTMVDLLDTPDDTPDDDDEEGPT